MKSVISALAFASLALVGTSALAADDILGSAINTDLVVAAQGNFPISVDKVGGDLELNNQAGGAVVQIDSERNVDDIGAFTFNSGQVWAVQINGPDSIGNVAGDLKKTNAAFGALTTVTLDKK